MNLTQALREAEDASDAAEFMSRTKLAVIRELERLDDSVSIVDTGYFNHSAVPDLCVSWGKEDRVRELFLRHSYMSVDAGEDVKHLQSRDPIVLALTNPSEIVPSQENAMRAAAGTKLLLTDSAAVEVIAEPNSEPSPLSALVRANFFRGAVGGIDEAKAERLVGLPDDTENDPNELISQSFDEDAALRIERTAQIMRVAINAELDFETVVTDERRLTPSELAHLLPWLLDNPQAVANTRFWAQLGKMISFRELEGIEAHLTGFDLTPLLNGNSATWRASRAYVGPARIIDESEEQTGPLWAFEHGRLGIDIGTSRLSVVHDGKKLKPRKGDPLPRWTDLTEPLADHRLTRVVLKGIQRSIAIDAETTSDVKKDIEDVVDSLNDDYFVEEVVLSFPGADTEEVPTKVTLKFESALALAESEATIEQLTRSAVEGLLYRSADAKSLAKEVLTGQPSVESRGDPEVEDNEVAD